MRTAINTRLVFEIPAKRRPGKQERRGVWLASRVVAASCRCGEPPLVDHGERSTGYRPFGAAAPAAWRSSPPFEYETRGRLRGVAQFLVARPFGLFQWGPIRPLFESVM